MCWHKEFANKTDLASLKWDIDKLDLDELKTIKIKAISIDFQKLSEIVDKYAAKKILYH